MSLETHIQKAKQLLVSLEASIGEANGPYRRVEKALESFESGMASIMALEAQRDVYSRLQAQDVHGIQSVQISTESALRTVGWELPITFLASESYQLENEKIRTVSLESFDEIINKIKEALKRLWERIQIFIEELIEYVTVAHHRTRKLLEELDFIYSEIFKHRKRVPAGVMIPVRVYSERLLGVTGDTIAKKYDVYFRNSLFKVTSSDLEDFQSLKKFDDKPVYRGKVFSVVSAGQFEQLELGRLDIVDVPVMFMNTDEPVPAYNDLKRLLSTASKQAVEYSSNLKNIKDLKKFISKREKELIKAVKDKDSHTRISISEVVSVDSNNVKHLLKAMRYHQTAIKDCANYLLMCSEKFTELTKSEDIK